MAKKKAGETLEGAADPRPRKKRHYVQRTYRVALVAGNNDTFQVASEDAILKDRADCLKWIAENGEDNGTYAVVVVLGGVIRVTAETYTKRTLSDV